MFENIPNYLPSLCIPRISTDVTKETLIHVLETLQLGHIQRVDLVLNNKHDGFQKVFIHFTKWTDDHARMRVLQGKPVHVVYNCNEPWFWKLCINKKDYDLHSYLS
jgi:hypothetical protein